MTREQHTGKPPPKVEAFDARTHDLGTVDVRQHLRRLVDGHDRMAEPDQLVRDASDAAAELEHRRRRGNRGVHDLSLAAGW
jgi:hypothetical protein